MKRRFIFAALAALVPGVASQARADAKSCISTNNKDSVSWTVPTSVKLIRVRSWSKDGDEVIDTHFRVRPGQVFQINVVKE